MRTKRSTWQSAAARRIVAFADIDGSVEDAVVAVAARLLENVPCPPTCLETLMTRLNVHRAEADATLPFSGELRREGNGFAVVYSASLSGGRRRFTIAHELGHAVFEQTGPNCPRVGHELERLCDMLASEFIFPRGPFSAAAGAKPDAARIIELAHTFGGSLTATALRCYKLCGVSAFEVRDSKLAWGFGGVRSNAALREEDIRDLVGRAMEGRSGEATVQLHRRARIGEWDVRWKCLRSNRAIFTLWQKAAGNSH